MNKEKYLARSSARLAVKIDKHLKSLRSDIVKLLIEQEIKSLSYERKGFISDMLSVISKYNNLIVDTLMGSVTATFSYSFSLMARKHRDIVGDNQEPDLSSPSSRALQYIEATRRFHLSDFRGSISHTTNTQIIDLVRDGIKRWASYSTIAEEIQKLDPYVFSETRAKLIASNETRRAYEAGWYFELREIEDMGNTVEKEWMTVHDGRVTPSHTANEAQGRIPLSQPFGPTGDMIPPASDNPRCRCTVKYFVNWIG